MNSSQTQTKNSLKTLKLTQNQNLHQLAKMNNNNKNHHTNYHNNSSRRTPSFSSSSSLSSSSSSSSSNDTANNADVSNLTTPSSTPGRFSGGGVPFSWEHLPGIPKKHLSKKKSINKKLIPLIPPPTNNKHNYSFLDQQETNGHNFARVKKSASFTAGYVTNPSNNFDDPFFAALVECSKDDDRECGDDNIRSDRSLMMRNAGKLWSVASSAKMVVSRSFGAYSSCKRTCGVSESIRILPRSSRTSYDLVNNHRSSHQR